MGYLDFLPLAKISLLLGRMIFEIRHPRSPDMVQAAQQTWEAFLNVFPSKIAAGEAIFTAIFDASPSLQATFKSPKATVAERFVKGFGELVRSAGSKSKMMNCVQILGFRHLEFDINIQKVPWFQVEL